MRKFELQVVLDLVDKLSGPLKSGPMKQLAALQRQTEIVDRSMDNLFLGGSIAGGAAVFAAPLIAGTVQAIRFEEAMADVKRVVDFPTPRAFKEMSSDVLQLSLRIPLATEELSQLVEAAGQSKLYKTRTELLRFAQDSGKMATAFKMSAADAGGAMTGFRTIFGLTQNEVVLLGDAYNYLGNNMDARASDIVNIANRTGAMAKLFGLTGQQVGALGATFLALKTPPEVAATGINSLLRVLDTAPQQTEKFQGGLAKLGLEATDLKRRIGTDAQGALLDFLQRVRGSGDVLGILTDLFGAEYSDDIAKLVGSLDTYENALGLVGSQSRYAGSMQEEYAAQAATTKNALVLLRNNFNALGITIGTFFLPVIQLASRMMGTIIGPILRLANANPVLARTLAFITAALILLTITAGLGIATIAGFTLATAQARIGLIAFAGVSGAAAAKQSLLNLALIGTRARFVAATTAARSFAAALAARTGLGMMTDVAKIEGAGGKLFRLRAILGVVQGGFVAAAGASWAFAVSLLANPAFWLVAGIVALVAALVGLGAGFVWAWRKSDEFRAGVMRGLEPMRRSWAALKEDIAALGRTFAPIGATFQRVMQRMGIDVSKIKGPLDALRYGFAFFIAYVGTSVAITFGRVFSFLTTGFGGLVQTVDGLVIAAGGLATLDFGKMMEGLNKARGGIEQTLMSPLELAGVDSKQFRADLRGVNREGKNIWERIGGWLFQPLKTAPVNTQPFAFGLNAMMAKSEEWGAATRGWIGERFETSKANTANLINSLTGARDEGRPIWRSLLDTVTAPFSLPRANRREGFMASLEGAETAGTDAWTRIKKLFSTFSLPWIKQATFTRSLADTEAAGGDAWDRIKKLFPTFNLPWVKRLSFDRSLTDAEGSGSTIWGRVTALLKVAIPLPGVDWSAVETTLGGMLTHITNFGPQLLEAGGSLIGNLIDGIKGRLAELTAVFEGIKLPGWVPGVNRTGEGRNADTVERVTGPSRVANRPATPAGMPSTQPGVPFDPMAWLRFGNVDPASDYGRLLVRGFEGGILDNRQLAAAAVQRMGADTQEALKRQLKIQSPSRVFAGLGAFIPQGLGQGILGQRTAVTRAMQMLAAAAVAVPITPALNPPEVAPSIPGPPPLVRPAVAQRDEETRAAPGGATGGQTVKHFSFSGANFNLDMSEINSKQEFVEKLEQLFEWFGGDEE